MSAEILLFPANPSRFVPRVEVREHWSHEGRLCHFRVMALDHNGEHLIDSFADPDEAEDFAKGFRLRYREEFAGDIARRRAAKSQRTPAPWWVDPDRGGAA